MMILSRVLTRHTVRSGYRTHRRGMHMTIDARACSMRLLILLVLLLSAPTAAAPAQDAPYRVLLIHSFRSSLPVNTDWYNGIVRGLNSVPELQFEIDIETPDLDRFGVADYVSNLLDIYQHKYHDNLPDLIIPTYTPALEFLLKYGEQLFPGVPIVFCSAEQQFVAQLELPPHITGVTTDVDFAGTLQMALQVHPGTRRVAVIVGSGRLDLEYERAAREALQRFEDKVEFTWLQGLPLDELSDAVAGLTGKTVILYLVQLKDKTGETYIPFNTLKQLSAVAGVPIYGLWDTLIGSGIIGGRMETPGDDGFQSAQMGLRILRGETPASIPVIYKQENPAIFDGRELARWNIGARRLPAGSHILHRQLSLWDEHRKEILIAAAVMALQGLFIIVLLLNRARLRRTQVALQAEHERYVQSESVVDRLQGRLAKFSKERTLGAMATGIAHEINQPLIAIQNYAQAAKRRLQSDVDQTSKLDELVTKIEQQAGRAGDIIQHIRTLVSSDETDLHPVQLDSLAEEVIQIPLTGLKDRGCLIDLSSAADLPAVLADGLQIQLVLVNLIHNAMQSMEASEEKVDKFISIDIRQLNNREQQVSVADRGPGIPADRVDSLFEPFYSDKANGMGIGLAICRSIIEAHGGRIGYTPNPAGGSMFQFTLPVATA